jgi:hypothetical protein
MNANETRRYMKRLSRECGNPLGSGTVERFLVAPEVSTVIDRIPPKHMRFFWDWIQTSS